MLSGRNFLPLFVTQFTGALNDNFFKSALVVLLTYRLADILPVRADILVTLTSGLFILPFFLFSALAGQLADRFDKGKVARLVKVAEVVLLAAGGFGFYMGHPTFLLAVLFGMGVHSAFFGPVKYALLPQHVPPEKLTMANGLIEAGTFIAIVLGTILGGALILLPQGTAIVSAALVLLAVTGYVSSRFIPPAPGAGDQLNIRRNVFAATRDILKPLYADKKIWRLMILISWFWLMGSVYLAQMPNFTRNILSGDQYVLTFLLSAFSLGIGVGSVACGALRRAEDDLRLQLAFSALGMTVFGLLLNAAVHPVADQAVMTGLDVFLSGIEGRSIFGCLFGLAVCAGFFVVPLYTRLQRIADPAFIARTMAGLNIINALFMVAGALLSAAALKGGLTARDLFLFLAAAHGFLAALFFARKADVP